LRGGDDSGVEQKGQNSTRGSDSMAGETHKGQSERDAGQEKGQFGCIHSQA